MTWRRAPALVLWLVAACAGTTPVPGPGPVPQQPPRAAVEFPAPQPIAPPAFAAAYDWMALGSTNVRAFRDQHPAADGRGVLIAILDSGLDPTVPGLDRTSTGAVKVVDIRDFSAEGRVELAEGRVEGDTIRLGPHRMAGAARLRTIALDGPVLAGTLREIPLGQAPAADLNGNGVVADTLMVVVVRASDGWVLLADTDGDGTLEDERPVRDYAVAQETFGWRTGARPSPLGVAVNFSGPAGTIPRLDLVFDNSGHGTHVAGIAAGHRLYGIDGFHGVAPGAVLLGVKISNDARGGITTTGSILQALEYAIRQARGRQLPLVVNLSFGVGNEIEGTARIDQLIDSVLTAHPDVVMTVSAGNDGPGRSTIGFPGSAWRVLSVGASYPGVFLTPDRGKVRPDLVAFFSARGRELPRPDLIAPGMAYSTVARWDVGEEVKSGTSMAAPHVAGLVANLLSAPGTREGPLSAETIRLALLASARPVGTADAWDQGAGQPDLVAAWEVLTGAQAPGQLRVRVPEQLRVLPARPDTLRFALAGGETHRVGLDVTAGQPFRITLEDEGGEPTLLFLHEPLGMPSRDGHVASSAGDAPQAVLEVDGRDAVPGQYEVVAVAGPGGARRAVLTIDPAPVAVEAARDGDSVTITLRSVGPDGFDGQVELDAVGGERSRSLSARGSDDHRTPVVLPDWTTGFQAEVRMPPAQWGLFTDFGLTLEDPEGRILELNPLNYAVGRLDWLVPETDGAAPLEAVVVLSPGWADPGGTPLWLADLTLRAYAEPGGGPAGPGVAVTIPPGQSRTVRLALPTAPYVLDPAWDPLGLITLTSTGGVWTTEVRLSPPLPPIMR